MSATELISSIKASESFSDTRIAAIESSRFAAFRAGNSFNDSVGDARDAMDAIITASDLIRGFVNPDSGYSDATKAAYDAAVVAIKKANAAAEAARVESNIFITTNAVLFAIADNDVAIKKSSN